MHTEQQTIVWESTNGNSNRATIELQHFTKKEALSRALKTGGLFLLASLCSIAIPGLHFVLVPGFLIAGLVMVWRQVRITTIALASQGICPNCSTQTKLKLGNNKFDLPRWEYCPTCDERIRLTEPFPSY